MLFFIIFGVSATSYLIDEKIDRTSKVFNKNGTERPKYLILAMSYADISKEVEQLDSMNLQNKLAAIIGLKNNTKKISTTDARDLCRIVCFEEIYGDVHTISLQDNKTYDENSIKYSKE